MILDAQRYILLNACMLNVAVKLILQSVIMLSFVLIGAVAPYKMISSRYKAVFSLLSDVFLIDEKFSAASFKKI
jgi:hypothetical protein